MTIIQFFKIVFGVSQKEPQEQTQQSNLDIANVQPSPEEYVVAEKVSLSPVEEQTTAKGLEASLTDRKEVVDETITSNVDSTDELQDFINEIDKEYSSENYKSDDTTTEDDQTEDDDSKPDEITSLLDNSPYMSLAESCCDLIKELDKLKSKDNQELVDLINSRIKEGLITSGAEPIAEEIAYDVIRHTAIGKSIVRKGTPIASTIEPGVAIDNKVMIKAKVQI